MQVWWQFGVKCPPQLHKWWGGRWFLIHLGRFLGLNPKCQCELPGDTLCLEKLCLSLYCFWFIWQSSSISEMSQSVRRGGLLRENNLTFVLCSSVLVLSAESQSVLAVILWEDQLLCLLSLALSTLLCVIAIIPACCHCSTLVATKSFSWILFRRRLLHMDALKLLSSLIICWWVCSLSCNNIFKLPSWKLITKCVVL